ncbi:MAG: putative 26S proteasome regulatory subunit 7A [Streblomastix strix]|uniref:Putative 26S proteasome regulatory subunit 7A n=1 Tax=Streblomastix strix TaxID=222440 RepID=A0A5J4X0A9_9EUKA|nr:MAG: putative 26S proteasome regulatory subunit 7A [Streblomastix strix]
MTNATATTNPAIIENEIEKLSQDPVYKSCKKLETEVQELVEAIKKRVGVKETETGLAPPTQWDLKSDQQRMNTEQPLIVARCQKIFTSKPNPYDRVAPQPRIGQGQILGGGAAGQPGAQGADNLEQDVAPATKYIVNIRHHAKYVVGLADNVAPTDIEEGMRVGCEIAKHAIKLPLPPRVDPTVSLMEVEDKPDATYNDVGGCKEQIEKLREVVEIPLLKPERFLNLGIDPPKGVLLYGPPGTGKTLAARAVANRTEASFIRIIGSELVQRYIGEGARMIRDIFALAKQKKACILFFDEIDAIGGTRFEDNTGESEVQRTMLELLNQLDGFESRGAVKVIMATNRPDILDPALMRPGRLDRKVEFSLPDLEGRTSIFRIHCRSMSCERGIRFDLLARLCPNSTGADIRSVCTEAGMFAIRDRRKLVSEKDMRDSIDKVIKGYAKFSATPKYMVYN